MGKPTPHSQAGYNVPPAMQHRREVIHHVWRKWGDLREETAGEFSLSGWVGAFQGQEEVKNKAFQGIGC